jgi:hypothetical protein
MKEFARARIGTWIERAQPDSYVTTHAVTRTVFDACDESASHHHAAVGCHILFIPVVVGMVQVSCMQ